MAQLPRRRRAVSVLAALLFVLAALSLVVRWTSTSTSAPSLEAAERSNDVVVGSRIATGPTFGADRGDARAGEDRARAATLDAAVQAVLRFTGRTLLTLDHPLEPHIGFSRFQCGVGGGGARPSSSSPESSPNHSPRYGAADAGAAAACMCIGLERIPTPCFPRFAPADLAARRTDSDAQQPYNVVVISMDTARADAFPFNGVPRRPLAIDTLPRPVRLLRHVNDARHPAVVFQRALATAPWTLPSHASMLSGFPPDAAGAYDDDHLVKVPLLGHHLGPAYCRVAFVSNSNLFPDETPNEPDEPVGPLPGEIDAAIAGFDAAQPAVLFRENDNGLRSFGWNGSHGWDRYAYFDRPDDAEQASLEFLRDVHRRGDAPCGAGTGAMPFLLFAHTNRLNTHEYGMDPTQYSARAVDTDRAVAALLDTIDFDTTIIVLTSDHGEGFEPNLGRFIHTGRVHQDLLHATLAVWHPRVRPAVDDATAEPRLRHVAPVSLLSIVPSLLAWTGHTVPDYLVGPVLPLPPNATIGALAGSGGTGTPAHVLSAVDLSYAFVLMPDGPHAWLAPFDLVVTSRAKNWNRRHVAVNDIQIRMTVHWPLKHITSLIDGVPHYATYNLATDPGETLNMLESGVLPSILTRGGSTAEQAQAALANMGDFYEHVHSLEAAIRSCPALDELGYGTRKKKVAAHTVDASADRVGWVHGAGFARWNGSLKRRRARPFARPPRNAPRCVHSCDGGRGEIVRSPCCTAAERVDKQTCARRHVRAGCIL